MVKDDELVNEDVNFTTKDGEEVCFPAKRPKKTKNLKYTGETLPCPWCKTLGDPQDHEIYEYRWGSFGKSAKLAFVCPKMGVVQHPSNVAQDTIRKLCKGGKCQPSATLPEVKPKAAVEPALSDDLFSRLKEVAERGKT